MKKKHRHRKESIFPLDIHETVGGDLFVKELALDEGWYEDEDNKAVEKDTSSVEKTPENPDPSFYVDAWDIGDYEESFDRTICYSESNSITVVKQHTSTDDSILKAYIHNHKNKDVSNKFKITEDGWYEILDMIVPTKEWLETMAKVYWEVEGEQVYYLDRFESIYIVHRRKLYRYDKDTAELTLVDFEDVIEDTNVQEGKASVWIMRKDTFVIYNLWQCYLNYCKKLFEGECSKDTKCPTCDDELNKNLQLIWILLNAIQYMVRMGKLKQAQGFLEDISGCNSLCSNEMFTKTYDCGC